MAMVGLTRWFERAVVEAFAGLLAPTCAVAGTREGVRGLADRNVWARAPALAGRLVFAAVPPDGTGNASEVSVIPGSPVGRALVGTGLVGEVTGTAGTTGLVSVGVAGLVSVGVVITGVTAAGAWTGVVAAGVATDAVGVALLAGASEAPLEL